MNEKIIRTALFEFFEGNHTAIQRKLIEEWLSFDPANQNLYYQYLDEWEAKHPQFEFDNEQSWAKVNPDAISVPIRPIAVTKNNISYKTSLIPFALVASLLVFLGAFLYFNVSQSPKDSYKLMVEKTKQSSGDIYEKINNTNKPLFISLPDGSSVILKSKSTLSYSPSVFKKNKREVLLSGEAFFEVQKNIKNPFFVVTNSLVTKVLGTSFTVKAYPTEKSTKVVVKTGKVAVYQNDGKNGSTQKLNLSKGGILLSANQQVTINNELNEKAAPQKVEIELLSLSIQKLSFEFDEVSIAEVFAKLENAYQIKIIYDKKRMEKCKLTAYLTDEPLAEKIRLICFAIDATYEIENNQIRIDSNGCN